MSWRLLKNLKLGSSIGRASKLKTLVVALSCLLVVNLWATSFKNAGREESSFTRLKERRTNKTKLHSSSNKDTSANFLCFPDGTQVFDREKAVVLGKPFKNKVFLTVGIPTIERTYKNKTVSYVERMLDSLIINMDEKDRDDIRFIIFLSDESTESRNRIKVKLKESFYDELEQGVMQIIEAPREFYPQLTGLKRTLGDSQERMYWRSKQTMDYVFLFRYAESLSKFYLQMEDDVTSVANYSRAIKEYIKQKENTTWVALEFSAWGFIGKLFRNSSLAHFAKFLQLFYNEMPCDWLLSNYFRLMGQPPDTLRLPELFLHIGIQSSSLGT